MAIKTLETYGNVGNVHVSKIDIDGNIRVDIRAYWTPEGEDKPKPTKKGVTIPLAKVQEFITLVEQAIKS